MISAMSRKGDQHEYITNLIATHPELFKTPHLKQLYSDSFKAVNKQAKETCANVSQLKWKAIEQTGAQARVESFQALANL